MATHRLYLGLGSNLGDRQAILRQAIILLGEKVGRVERVSTFVESEPWGYKSPHKFLNACCLLLTSLSPWQCLRETQAIERQLGREEKTKGGAYHDRLIDIDLLLYDDLSLRTPLLTIPHPLMQKRDFVVKPLREITPP